MRIKQIAGINLGPYSELDSEEEIARLLRQLQRELVGNQCKLGEDQPYRQIKLRQQIRTLRAQLSARKDMI